MSTGPAGWNTRASTGGFGPAGLNQQQARTAEDPSRGSAPGPGWSTRASTGQLSSGQALTWADYALTQERSAPRWPTGGQWGSTENGYNSPFYDTFFRQQEEEASRNNLHALYQRQDFTGIVTYDGAQDARGRTAKVGDIYENGALTGNLYQQYNRADATQILADLTLSPEVRRRAYESQARGDLHAVEREVETAVEQATSNWARFRTQSEYEDAVSTKKTEFEEQGFLGSATDEVLTFLAGAAGGALSMAWAGPWAAVAGFFSGGTTALMNQDEILDQAARSAVQTDMAYEQFGTWGGLSTQVQGWAGLAGKFTQPLTNLTHGIYDAYQGNIGDGRSEWYVTNEDGEGRPWWVTGLGLVAGVGDAAFLFSSAPGAIAYQTQMSVQIGSSVSQLASTGGHSFSDYHGSFDNIFTDDEGNFDPVSAAAGIGSIGIDAVQLGTARGLMNMYRRNAGGQEVLEAGGRLFTRGADGTMRFARGAGAEGSKLASTQLSILAPSEFLTAVSARVGAQRLARLRGTNVVSADDYYRAATRLAEGQGTWVSSLVTGFGEGYEEFLQAVLEPVSHNAEIDWMAAFEASLQGAAMGTGMQLGSARLRNYGTQENPRYTPNQRDRMYSRAALSRWNAVGQPEDTTPEQVLSREEFDKLPASTQQAWANLDPGEAEVFRAALEKLEEQQATTYAIGTVGVDKVRDSALKVAAAEARKGGPRTDGSFVITAANDAEVAGDEVLGSFAQVTKILEKNLEGMQEQITFLERVDGRDGAAEEITDLRSVIQQGEVLLGLVADLQKKADKARKDGDRAEFRKAVKRVNEILRGAFRKGALDGKRSPSTQMLLMRAASVLFVRNPQDQAGSYPLVVPLVDQELAWTQSDFMLMVSPAMLQAIGGDYDGDKIVHQAKVHLTAETFMNLRMGRPLLGAATDEQGRATVNIATRAYEKAELAILANGLASANDTVSAEAAAIQAAFIQQLRSRYFKAIPHKVLHDVIERLKEALEVGNPKSREMLLADLLDVAGDELWAFARENVSNEFFWIDQQFQRMLQRFQTWNASHTASTNPGGIIPTNPVKRTSKQHRILVDQAATEGQTLMLRTTGWSPFRTMQKLNYSVLNAAVLGNERSALDEALAALQELYSIESRDQATSLLEAAGSRDDIATNVLSNLMGIASDSKAPARDILMLAQMEVADLDVINGELKLGSKGPISLLQLMLRQAIKTDMHDKAAVVTPELEAKWASLDKLTRPGQHSQALVSMMGGVALYEVLGPASSELGPHLTVEQFVRLYAAQDEQGRRLTSQRMRRSVSYGKERQEGEKDAPYSEAQLENMNSYRVLVEAMVEAGNARHTEVQSRSDRYQKVLEKAFEIVQLLFTEMGWNISDPETVARVFQTYPDFGRTVLDLIPDAEANAAFRNDNGKLRVAAWVYDMLALPPKQAAMHYWRNSVMNGWHALGARHGEEDGDKARTYQSLTNRVHRVMYRLKYENDGGLALLDFTRRIEEASDLDTFIDYLNTTHRANNEAPFAAWVTDVSEFDVDRPNGGWSSTSAGSEQRDAIMEFRKKADMMVVAVREERKAAKADNELMRALDTADRLGSRANDGDAQLLLKLDRAIEFGTQMLSSLGPEATRQMLLGSMKTFYGQAHNKGAVPTVYAAHGAYQALADLPGYATPYERLRDTLISVDAQDFSTNAQTLARDDMDIMDEQGTQIDWKRLDRSTFLKLWRTNKDARPMLRAILFPSTYETTPTGHLTQKFLTGLSLKSLLDSGTYDSFFKDSTESKFTYLSMLDAQAKKYGELFASSRAVSDILLSHTSTAEHALTEGDYLDRVDSMMLNMADIGRLVGSVYSNDGELGLRTLRDELQHELESRRGSRLVNVRPEDRETVRKLFKDELKNRAEDLRQQAVDAAARGDLERSEAILEFSRSLETRLDTLLDSTSFTRFRASLAIDWSASQDEIDQRKLEIKDFFVRHRSMLTKTPWATEEIQALLNPRDSALTVPVLHPHLETEKGMWDTLVDAATAGFIEAHTSHQAEGVPVPEFVFGKDFQRRYLDPTFGYLLDILDPKSAFAQTARDLHLAHYGENRIEGTAQELRARIKDTVLNEDILGDWSFDIARASLEAQQRLDSSAAPDGVAASGISPRGQMVLTTATTRTTRTDTLDATVSKGVVPVALIAAGEGQFKTDLVTEKGTVPGVLTYVGLLNGRFARGARLVDRKTGKVLTDLWTPRIPRLGREAQDYPDVAKSGYRVITLRGLRRAVEAAIPAGMNPDDLAVELDYLHPDSQPAKEGYYHSLFYEGMSFDADDMQRSLISTLWFSHGSVSPMAQAEALQANKKGKLAYILGTAFSAKARRDMEQNFATDFSEMLMEKANAMMSLDLGSGVLDPTFFNAVLKDIKMRHFVRGTIQDGEIPGKSGEVLLSAEEVIAWQRANPSKSLLDVMPDAKLWKPSVRVLRSMLGETGDQGPLGVLPESLEMDESAIKRYQGITQEMLDRVPGWNRTNGDLFSTQAAQRTFQSRLRISPIQTRKEKRQLQESIQYDFGRKMNILAARKEKWSHGQAAEQLSSVAAKISTALETETPGFNLATFMPFLGSLSETDKTISNIVFRDLQEATTITGQETAWDYLEFWGGKLNGDVTSGVITQMSLDPNEKGYSEPKLHERAAPGELVNFGLAQFMENLRDLEKAYNLASKRLTMLAGQRLTIALTDLTGSRELRNMLGRHLESLGYTKVAGSGHLYQPVHQTNRYQTQRARESTLLATHTEDARNIMVAFLANNRTPLHITENAAYWVSRNPRQSVALPIGLVPVNAYGGFGRPRGPEQVAKVKREIETMLEPKQFAHLLELSNISDDTSAEAVSLRDALQRYVENADDEGLWGQGTDAGLGDIIPLVNRHDQILLYRHAMKAPLSVEAQLSKSLTKDGSARGVAIYSAEPNPDATAYTGEVIQFESDSMYALKVSLRVPLQDLGNKIQIEANGMKYVLTPAGDRVIIPDHALFSNGVEIDFVSDLDAALSKESTGGLVNNLRNAFAFFGIDLVPDLVKFFLNVDYHQLDAERQARAFSLVSQVLTHINRNAEHMSSAAVKELMAAPYFDQQLDTVIRSVGLEELGIGVDKSWRERFLNIRSTDSVQTKIGRAAVLYMMLPQADPSHIMRAGGFNNPNVRTDPKSLTLFMPRIFTEALQRDADVTHEMVARMNGQINQAGQGNQAYWLNDDFTFSMVNANGEQLEGYLQFARAFPSGDNPVLDAQAFARSGPQNWSRHSLDMAWQAIGARTAAEKGLERTARFLGLRSSISKGSFWELLNDTSNDGSTPMFMRERPGEQARRQLAYEAVGAFRHKIGFDKWKDTQKDAYLARRNELAQRVGLTVEQSVVFDYWIRQMLGMPLGEADLGHGKTKMMGEINYEWAMETLEEIAWNFNNGLLPTAGAEVPQIHLYDLAMLFEANNGASPRFRLVEGPGVKTPVTSWEGWVEVALGTGQIEHKLFDPMFLLATDGFMHTFQDALDSLVGLTISRDMLTAAKMMDPTTDRLLHSLDPRMDRVQRDPAMLQADQATFAQLMGLERITDGYRDKRPDSSVLAQRRKARIKWRKENGVPMPLDVTMRNFRKNGAQFVEDSAGGPAIMRILTNLRVGNALLNPLLWVAAVPEYMNRMVLDEATNLIMGQSTGALGTAAEKAGANRYSPEELHALHELYQEMGLRKDFKEIIYKDLVYKQPRLNNAGRLERWTANYAKFGASWQDPTYGLPVQAVARRYMEKALEELANLGSPATVQQVVDAMRTDPAWIQKNFPDVHLAASNTISNMRSIRPTMLSLALRGIYEPMTQSGIWPVSMTGHLLKIPMIFSGYLTNVMTTVTGMQGFANMAAMFVEGRNKGLIGRIQAAIKGEAYDPETSVFDMSTALDGINLSKMFIQGGLTHTGLFALGLAAGGLGLSGEDEEERRRRRAAQTTGGQFLYDPRRLQNDFRNADTIYLDWLPFGLSSFFKVDGENGENGRAMAHLPWIYKQFISPIIGMERFFDTGDPREILWGFQDAIGAMPLFNASMWDNSVAMFGELMASADDAAKSGSPRDLAESYGLMVSALGTLERMLFENSFINMLYVGQDSYDRDPWKRPLTDAGGEQQYDALGNPRSTDALTNFVDPETGEVRAGYVNHTWQEATLRQLTESRFTLALATSLLTGQGLTGDTLRNNMVVKQRVIEKPELTMEQAEGLLLTVMDAESYGRTTELLTETGARGVFQSLYNGSIGFDSPALEGVYIPLDMRQAIQDKWMAELTAQGMMAGLSQKEAEQLMWDVWLGSGNSPYGVGISDILWSQEIPYASTVRYNQLNTNYVMGPNGMPYAVGAERDFLFTNLGGVLPNRYRTSGEANLPLDGRLNSIDEAVRLNTGMRALERIDDSWMVPTEQEIGDSITKSLEDLSKNIEDILDKSGYGSYNGGGRRGWVNYPRRTGWSRRSGGYGGGYGGAYYGSTYVPNYGGNPPRFDTQRRVRAPHSDDLYNINTSNPIIRRANIRRERFASERGRLNQWQ